MPSRYRQETFHKLKWLCFWRLVLAVAGIAIVLLQESGRMTPRPALILLLGVCALDILYLAVLRLVRAVYEFTLIQIAVDILLVSALVYLTGCVKSNFTPLYFACLLAASTALSMRVGILFASFSTVLLALVTTVYILANHYHTKLPFVSSGWEELFESDINYTLSYLIAQSIAFHLVAFLSGRLAAGLSRIRILSEEILQNMTDGVVTLDPEGRIVFVNPRARRLLGLNPHRPLVGEPAEDVFTEEHHTLITRAGSGPPATFETMISPDGKARHPTQITTSFLRDEKGRSRGLIAILRDLTLQKKMDEILKRMDRLETVGEAAAEIAHEIRNPLASIRGSAQELGTLPVLSAEERRLLDIIVRESDRLDRIVTDFLGFARLRKPRNAPVDLRRILEETALLLRKRDDADAFRMNVAAFRPPALRGDAEQMQQVFMNIALNAFEATGGKGALEARPGPSEEGWYALEFANDGPPIAPEHLPRVFTPFFSTKSRGTGMGLAIADRIIEAHGGEITVRNLSPRGVVFTVILPLPVSDTMQGTVP